VIDADWPAPLPDFTNPAVDTRIRIGTRTFQILISPVIRDGSDEPDTDLVQLMVVYEGRPLTLHDLGASTARCSTLWSYLASKLTEATVDFYDPRPRAPGEPNPRLGCWGTRPDLLDVAAEDDCSLAVVIGISIWRVGARPRSGPQEFVRQLGAELAEVLAYWVLRIEQDRAQLHRPASGA